MNEIKCKEGFVYQPDDRLKSYGAEEISEALGTHCQIYCKFGSCRMKHNSRSAYRDVTKALQAELRNSSTQ